MKQEKVQVVVSNVAGPVITRNFKDASKADDFWERTMKAHTARANREGMRFHLVMRTITERPVEVKAVLKEQDIVPAER